LRASRTATQQSLYSEDVASPPPGTDAGSRLRVRAAGSQRLLDGETSYRIGRDPASDIVVSDPRVSWAHATVRRTGDGWLLEDAASTNGVFFGERKVHQVVISADCTIRLGHPADGPELVCTLVSPPRLAPAATQAASARRPLAASPPPPIAAQPAGGAAAAVVPAPRAESPRSPATVHTMLMKTLRIGRAPDNDVVVADLSVSRNHAELHRTSSGFELVDCGSHNGTFLNGQRITVARVTPSDLIGVGPATFRLVGDQLEEYLDTGDISLAAHELTVRLPGGKVLLDKVGFALGERCFLGVIGPSGAGKSTLLGALTGIAPATEGHVLYNGRDLYASYAELRHRIGLVPQQNILHTQLTVRRALEYAAALRFPPDTSKHERNRRIDEVLGELALTEHANTRTSALSGGQQKRVNVALELLTKPSLLFLDEPTSGLDPGLDKSVMQQMAALAHDGRTVIVVTHSVANLNLCDRLLVLVSGGKVAYFGPPGEGLRHFGTSDWAEVFQAFDREPGRDWAGEYRASQYYQRYITAERSSPARPVAATRELPLRTGRGDQLSQLRTLTRRYLDVITSDRLQIGIVAGLPLALGLLTRVIPAPQGLLGPDNLHATALLLVLSVGAVLSGTANAIWEIVKERAIYSRERAAGLSPGAYLWSKVLVLGVISGLQAIVLVAIGLIGRPLPAHGVIGPALPELMVAMFGLGVASMTLGLLISSLVDTSEKAMPLLVVVVMFQLVLCGGIFPLAGKVGLDQISWLSPSRWGYAASASTVNLNSVIPPTSSSTDPLWGHSAGIWLLDMALLAVLALAFALLAMRRLTTMGPLKRR
jgi:ABC transport system ATP-binding/permease protein